jgi:hypothetical protein
MVSIPSEEIDAAARELCVQRSKEHRGGLCDQCRQLAKRMLARAKVVREARQ